MSVWVVVHIGKTYFEQGRLINTPKLLKQHNIRLFSVLVVVRREATKKTYDECERISRYCTVTSELGDKLQ